MKHSVTQLSFIIPVLDEAERVGELLDDLRQRFPHAETIVVDGGSSDDTVARATPRCTRVLQCAPQRAGQMNLGARGAQGRYLIFLHADTSPGCDEEAFLRSVAGAPAWGFNRVRLSGAGLALRVVEWFINQRSRLSAIGTGDQMIFVRADIFAQGAGYEAIPLMEDVALCKRLRRIERPHILSQPVVTSSRRWEQGGVVATVLRMWCLRLGYFLGVSPQRLWHYYYGR